MTGRTFAILTLCSLFPLTTSGQKTDRDIKKKEQELHRLRTDIQSYERKLRESEQKERSVLDRLDDLERQANLMRQLIRSLREEEIQITTEIHGAKETINGLESRLQSLKAHYAGYVRSVYKNGRVYDLELLFSSNSVNQLYIRIQYLKRFSEQRARDLRSIGERKSDLEQQNLELMAKLERERILLAEKTREETNLRSKYGERKSTLAKVRKDKKSYQTELSRKLKAVQQVEQLIADLVERERVRKEQLAAERRQREFAEARERERTRSTPPLKTPEIIPDIAFNQRRGSLRWPVGRGSIQAKFGNQIHPVLKTVTQNPGVDIATPLGSEVMSVAEGEVALVSFIPGFGNMLIINHFDGYRTVYAHLAEVLVSESQRVKEGTVIARSGESVNGSVLHFELWKEREKQNPETWLARQ